MARAREWWDGLTGGPELGRLAPFGEAPLAYSDAAAAAILRLAVALWSDTAAALDGQERA